MNATSPVSSGTRQPGAANAVVIGVIAAIALFGLFIAGVTFFGLAIAFPIAVPIASQFHVYVSAADAALAERFADLWWVFGGLSVASIAAAVVVAVKAIQHLSPTPRD